MAMEIKIPSVGESITEALLAEWFKEDGDRVKKDEPIFVLETDKVTLEIEAEADGVLRIKVKAGETVRIGDVVGTIETVAGAGAKPAGKAKDEKKEPAREEPAAREKEEKEEEKEAPPVKKAAKEAGEEPPEKAREESKPAEKAEKVETFETPQLSPSVRRLAEEKDVDLDRIEGTGPGGRITKGDVILHLESREAKPSGKEPEKVAPKPSLPAEDEEVERKRMTPIRKRIAARLLESKQNTAMLTTFNEIDMGRAMDTRNRYKDGFKTSHGVALGFMSFFIKASVAALKEFPEINASIEGDDIVYHRYYHVGVAIGTGKGLVVPVIRHADRLSYAGIEQAIVDYVGKIKDKKLGISDMEGGTFTITNGGVFGSLLSTPILNYPQSGILGMHKIEKRPIVIDDQIAIRPMMYVALSYDHRIVDGREAVTFLRRIKEFIEDPDRMLLEV